MRQDNMKPTIYIAGPMCGTPDAQEGEGEA